MKPISPNTLGVHKVARALALRRIPALSADLTSDETQLAVRREVELAGFPNLG
jgi:hypothetical protein